jgi:serine/threonine protein kinase
MSVYCYVTLLVISRLDSALATEEIRNGEVIQKKEKPKSKYEMEGPLNAGTSGNVWKARVQSVEHDPSQPKDGTTVAVKLSKGWTQEPKTEYDLQERASKTNVGVIPLYEFFQIVAEDGEKYSASAMKFAETSMLEKTRSRGMDLHMAKYYFYQMVQAIEHSHRNGVVHGDIKPDKFLLDKTHVYVSDFASAQLCTETGDPCAANVNDLRPSNTTRGTFGFLPSKDEVESEHSLVGLDVFALGVTFYAILTGDDPTAHRGTGPGQKKYYFEHGHVPSYAQSSPSNHISLERIDVDPEDVLRVPVHDSQAKKLILDMCHPLSASRPSLGQVLENAWLQEHEHELGKVKDISPETPPVDPCQVLDSIVNGTSDSLHLVFLINQCMGRVAKELKAVQQADDNDLHSIHDYTGHFTNLVETLRGFGLELEGYFGPYKIPGTNGTEYESAAAVAHDEFMKKSRTQLSSLYSWMNEAWPKEEIRDWADKVVDPGEDVESAFESKQRLVIKTQGDLPKKIAQLVQENGDVYAPERIRIFNSDTHELIPKDQYENYEGACYLAVQAADVHSSAAKHKDREKIARGWGRSHIRFQSGTKEGQIAQYTASHGMHERA